MIRNCDIKRNISVVPPVLSAQSYSQKTKQEQNNGKHQRGQKKEEQKPFSKTIRDVYLNSLP